MTVSKAVDAALRLLNWLVPVVYGSNLVSSETGRVIGATFLILLFISALMTWMAEKRGNHGESLSVVIG
jgi:hypothetical protein